MDPEAKILKFPPDRTAGPDAASEQDRSMDAQTQGTTAAVLAPPVQADSNPPPVWIQRFFLVTTVVFCLWVGFVMAVLPWQPVWTDNALVTNFPTLRWLLGTGFVRGLATGLGMLDLWIGISEAVHYRDRR